MPNDIPDYTGLQRVQIQGSSAIPLGDTSPSSIPADTANASISTGVTFGLAGSAVLASLKATAGATILQVGALGAYLSGTATAVNPLYGQPTVATHCGVAWVVAYGAEPTTAAAGWVKIVSAQPSPGIWVAIWVRPNLGAAEAAPAFTSAGAGNNMRAQLGEFSGVAVASPGDQTSSAAAVGANISIANASPDAAIGDLVLLAVGWTLAPAQAGPTTASFNNGAVTVVAGDDGATLRTSHASFAYGIVPASITSLPLGVRTWDYDAFGSSAPAAGTVASVVLAAVAGKAYRCALIDASFENGAAVVAVADVQLLDGAAVIFTRVIGLPAAIGQSNGFSISGLGIKGTVGNSMTLRFTAGIATCFQRVNLGAYLG